VLCGLTAAAAVLGSARHSADLDYHVMISKQGVVDNKHDDFLPGRVLVKFVDVVELDDAKGLF
jgi:nicotinamidase-related amidase